MKILSTGKFISISLLSFFIGLNSVSLIAQDTSSSSSLVRNDSACIKGTQTIEGLKSLTPNDADRLQTLEKTSNSLQSLCSAYLDFFYSSNQNQRSQLYDLIKTKADIFDHLLKGFVENAKEANLEYTPDNFGQLAATSVALKVFKKSLEYKLKLVKDPIEEKVFKTIMSNLDSTSKNIKKLLSYAPNDVFAYYRDLYNNLALMNTQQSLK